MTRPLEDWQSREGLMKGRYAFDEVLPWWHPGHTRRAVAIDPGEGLDTQSDPEWQTLTGCKSSVKGVKICIPSKELSRKTLL